MPYEPTWGALIGCYLFLAGLGGGAFLTSTFLHRFHPQATSMIRMGRVIAPVTVIAGLLLLVVDAEAGFHNPLRFAFLLTNFGSIMTWGVVFLGVFIVVALVVLFLDLKHLKVPAWLEGIGAVFGFLVGLYTGLLLGACKTFPLWNNALLPVIFIVSAVSTGMAAVLLAGAIKKPAEFNRIETLKKFHCIFPVVELFLVVVLLLMLPSQAAGAGAASVAKLVTGEYALVFWLVFLVIGLIAPTGVELWLLFFTRPEFEHSRKAHALSAGSSIAVLIGGFALRMLVLYAAVPITMTVPWT